MKQRGGGRKMLSRVGLQQCVCEQVVQARRESKRGVEQGEGCVDCQMHHTGVCVVSVELVVSWDHAVLNDARCLLVDRGAVRKAPNSAWRDIHGRSESWPHALRDIVEVGSIVGVQRVVPRLCFGHAQIFVVVANNLSMLVIFVGLSLTMLHMTVPVLTPLSVVFMLVFTTVVVDDK